MEEGRDMFVVYNVEQVTTKSLSYKIEVEEGRMNTRLEMECHLMPRSKSLGGKIGTIPVLLMKRQADSSNRRPRLAASIRGVPPSSRGKRSA